MNAGSPLHTANSTRASIGESSSSRPGQSAAPSGEIAGAAALAAFGAGAIYVLGALVGALVPEPAAATVALAIIALAIKLEPCL